MVVWTELLVVYLVINALLSLFFVRWVLWRNRRLTELIVWHHRNSERFKVLDRFRTSPRPQPAVETPSEPAGEREPYSIDDLEIADVSWALEE